mmetsp:Transcript_22685/g.35290  ORF Transcript_22685/g.35290 Transcript_22685/m.35290 type:complete len:87 (-) Transcript_22685:268-528(-)
MFTFSIFSTTTAGGVSHSSSSPTDATKASKRRKKSKQVKPNLISVFNDQILIFLRSSFECANTREDIVHFKIENSHPKITFIVVKM